MGRQQHRSLETGSLWIISFLHPWDDEAWFAAAEANPAGDNVVYCYILLHIAIAIYYILHTDLYCTLMFLCLYEALREEAGEYLEVLGIWSLIVTLGTL